MYICKETIPYGVCYVNMHSKSENRCAKVKALRGEWKNVK